MDRISSYRDSKETLLVERDENSFRFSGDELPKLTLEETSVSLLKEEELIKPIYEGFSSILRRRFFHDALSKITEYQAIPLGIDERLQKNKELGLLFRGNFSLNLNLFFLSKYFKNVFNLIKDHYKAIFPFISAVTVQDLGKLRKNIGTAGLVPVACIKEKANPDKWIPITELSSGMQKVLLILTDSFLLPDGGVYLIDEYENSLGIGAIEFLPSFMLELEKDVQFLITSHHPYLINNIPVKNWYVFHRRGSDVTIKFGDELTERYGKSKQQAFIKLINDPFYLEGVE
jgi:hypothetical protein